MARSLIEAGLGRLSARFLGSRKVRALLTTLGVAFGVALIAAMTILGSTLEASIAAQLRQGFGSYDIMAGYHGKLMQPEEQEKLGETPGVTYSVGLLYLSPNRPETQGVPMTYNYIGIGDFPPGQFAYPLREGNYPGPHEFVTDPRIAEKMGLKVGDTVTLPFKSGVQTLKLSGITKAVSGKESSEALFMNLTWLQEQMDLGRQTTLMLFGVQSIDLKQAIGTDMAKMLPDLDIQLRTELDDVVENMGGLKPVAIAFGVAGLFASVFLVAGSFNIAVQERSRELALLRAIGAGQKQVMRLVLREALLLGALGGLTGLALGAAGAWGALGVTARSLGVEQHPPVFPWLCLALEWLAGILLALVAAWSPARSAGAVPPLEAMRPNAQQEARAEKVGGKVGLVLMALGAIAVAMAPLLQEGTGQRALLGAAGGLVVVAGLISAQPRILPVVVHLLARPLKAIFPAEATLAGRSVLRHRKRSALTAATLVLGTMLVTSVTTIFGWLMENNREWVRSQFPGDAMISVGPGQMIGAELASDLAQIDGVTAVGTHGRGIWGYLQNFDASKADPNWLARQQEKSQFDKTEQPAARLALVPIDLITASRVYGFGQVQGDLAAEGVTMTEQQARERGIKLGDSLTFQPDRFMEQIPGSEITSESRSYQVVAIVERLPFYAAETAVSRSLFPGEPDARVFFNYAPAKRSEVKQAVETLLAQPQYRLTKFRDYTEELAVSEQMGNQRFAVLGAVTGVIFLVAMMGLVNSVITALHQRKREMATLRAVGSTPAQTARQVLLESLLLGLAGSLTGLVAGGLLTFGIWAGLGDGAGSPVYWVYATCLLAGPLLAATASLLPAWQVARGPVSHALHVE